MKEFLINSENLLNKEALRFLREDSAEDLIPCRWIRFNDKIKLAYFEEGYTSLTTVIRSMTLEQLCEIGTRLLKLVLRLENTELLTPENLTLDTDSIYIGEDHSLHCIYVPVELPEESLLNPIYIKRIYAILEEMCEAVSEGADIWRRMEYEKANNPGGWKELVGILDDPYAETSNMIYLKGINTPTEVVFQVGQEEFLIGSDRNSVDGFIAAENEISPVHARIFWDENGFSVMDMDSAGGTYVNDQRIDPMTKVRFGFGSILRFAEYTFSVE
ncbi:MAG: FHA domain-containing protein [Lachnospiraceae bacterium]|nr:FHA domain-containing protein [Lachnospiraceae bacterium]